MDVFETIHAHRSIRRYRPDPVPDDLLDDLLAAGIRASSSGNMQTCSIIVTRSPALRRQLLEPHMQQSMVVEAPVLLTFCADFHRMRAWLRLRGAADNFDNFFSFLIGAIDAALVAQNVALAAEARGLGICYLGSTLASCDEIGRILKLPPQVVPVTGFTLGYPDEDPPLRDRLPLDGLVHHDTYQDYSDERILELYAEREVKGWERYMASERLRKLVEEAGVDNLARFYTSPFKYPKDRCQAISRRVLACLAEQGYMENGG